MSASLDDLMTHHDRFLCCRPWQKASRKDKASGVDVFIYTGENTLSVSYVCALHKENEETRFKGTDR